MKATTSLSIRDCFASIQKSFAPFPYSKPYLMFFAFDAIFAAIDFVEGNVDDGKVDNPPSQGPMVISILSPSLLKSRTWKAMESNRFLHVLHKKKGSHF